MEYKEFFEKALSAAEQKYPCSDIETALGNITERAKRSEQSTELGQHRKPSEANAHRPSDRFFPILRFTVGAAALLVMLGMAVKFVMDNGVLVEGGPRPADTKVTTDMTDFIITTVGIDLTDVEDTTASSEVTVSADRSNAVTEVTASPSNLTDSEENTPTDSTSASEETTAPIESDNEQPTDDELKALVAQGADACGLKVTVSDLTRASLKLHYVRDKSVKNAEMLAYSISDRYEIQVQKGGIWQTYDPVNLQRWNDEEMWFDSLLGLGGEEYGGDEDELILFYGDNMYETEIPVGYYRIAKTMGVRSEITGEFLGQLTAYAEFTIDELTQNLFDIATSLDNVTPEGATWIVWQDGHNYFHVKRNLGYYLSYIIERKNNKGEWEEVAHNPNDFAPNIEPLNENGVTEIQINWKRIYGSLADGTYRISKQFVNYAGTGSKQDDIINCSVYYSPEFEIIGSRKDWGITLSVDDDVTAEGLTLVISQRGGNYTGELHYGEPYSIERKNGDKWEPLEYLDGAVWHDLAYIVEPNTDKEIKLDWKWLYGTMSAGKYRLSKEFMDFRGTGNYDKQTFYVQFEITENMTSKLGITLRAAQYNARRMTLQIVQSGGTGDENIGTSKYRYTIERKENGKWQSYYSPQAGVPTLDIGLKVKRSDVTEVKLDWRETAGSLPVGDYRLGMTFDCGDITETRYCEFTVEESMTNELGISIKVMELSKTGAKLGIDSKGADEQGYAYFDKNLYTLEKKNSSGKWKNVVSTASSEMFTGKIAMCETGYAGMLETINWSGWCGALSSGNYRISFKFYTGEGNSYKEVTLYAEFDITADTPETLTD